MPPKVLKFGNSTGEAGSACREKSSCCKKKICRAAIEEAEEAKKAGEERVILFSLSGHGHFDLAAYDQYFSGELQDYEYPQEEIDRALEKLPAVEA